METVHITIVCNLEQYENREQLYPYSHLTDEYIC